MATSREKNQQVVSGGNYIKEELNAYDGKGSPGLEEVLKDERKTKKANTCDFTNMMAKIIPRNDMNNNVALALSNTISNDATP